jgi:hypothetical protein
MDHLCVIHPFLLGRTPSANGLLATFERASSGLLQTFANMEMYNQWLMTQHSIKTAQRRESIE